MVKRSEHRPVVMAFERKKVTVPIDNIQPLRPIDERTKKSSKYLQIQSSIREVGLVEPPVVARGSGEKHKYLLLDGHLRIEALRELGMMEVFCLIATDDEAFTYNKRISRIATIQERNMILTAIKRGVPEERIAKVLNVNVSNIQIKKTPA